MKKVLFYSVAFAAALTSCTKEEVFVDVTAGNETQDLSIRPTLGDIVLTGDAASVTRFSTGAGAQAKFDEGDKLGAAIMDAPVYTSIADYDVKLALADGDTTALYKIVEYYSSNSAFTYDGSAWWLNEDQPLVEGNYLFYAPYNATKPMRSPYEICVPAEQITANEAGNGKGALDAYYADVNNVAKIGYQFLAAKGGKAQKPSVTMHDLMAYPKFTIKNNFKGFLLNVAGTTVSKRFDGGTITLDSVQFINATGADLVIGGKLSNQDVKDILSDEWATSPFEAFTEQVLSASDRKKVADGEKITSVIIGKEIASGASAEFYAVLPAVRFAQNQLQADIYVTIGGKPYVICNTASVSSDTDNSDVESFSITNLAVGQTYKTATGPVTLIKGQRYPQEELNFAEGKLSAKLIAGNALTIDLKGGKHNKPAKNGYATTNNAVVAREVLVPTTPGVTPPAATELIDNNAEFVEYFMNLENGSALVQNTAITNMPAPYTSVEFNLSNTNTVVINSDLIDALYAYNNKGSLLITSVLPIADDVVVTYVDATHATFTSKNSNSFTIEFGNAGYVFSADCIEAVGKSIHVLNEWTASAPAVTGNVIVYKNAKAEVQAGVQFEATTFVNNGTLNANGIFIKPVTNNGVINAGTATYLNVNQGTGTINLTSAAKNNNLNVTAPGQTGILSVNAVPAANPYTWVKTLDLDLATIDMNTSLANIKNFENVRLNATAINFAHSEASKEYDMGTTKYILNHTAPLTITGVNMNFTTVKNFNIKNEGTQTVKLSLVAASGSYDGPENTLLTDNNPTSAATWNGAAIVIP